MKDVSSIIGKFLLFAVIISSALMAVGGMLYLLQHHQEVVNFGSFHSEPTKFTSLPAMFHDAFSLGSGGLIQVGLLLLFITQILRVGLTACSFLKLKNNLFFGISLFIFLVLMISFVWSF